MARDQNEGLDGEDPLPDKAAAKEFYSRYEPKEVLGK